MNEIDKNKVNIMSKVELKHENYKTIKRLGGLIIADIFYALALDLFYVENDIVAGGLAGIGTIMNSLFSIPVGATVFVLNLPIVIWAIWVKGKRYVLITIVATGLFSLIVDLLSFLPCITDEKIVAAICGGMLYGIAAAIATRVQISTGGTDLLAKLIITKLKSVSLGTLYLCIDGFIVAMAMVIYHNVESGIYAIMAIAVCSIVTDKLNTGFNKAVMFYIFASNGVEKLSKAVLNDMHRGATLIRSVGMYERAEKEVLIVVVKPIEVPSIKRMIKRIDSGAFVVEVPATEIIGEGFDNIDLTTTINE